ncbi:NAD-dependent epimerase/dehydratase family protein [Halobacteriovorax marinus]|uniref:NAD-dependent epimerase/dehydratase family protein n=1 Tax=Halobacteriovorax marinus TaxID=97084 RepID=UPI00030A8EBD|nr:NAD-dependent epimerase/dehydratase family protein [Halobacteriovorax marinus]
MSTVLVFGGNSFVGRELVEMLLSSGTKVVTFNRSGNVPGIESDQLLTLKGDVTKREDLDQLADYQFEIVVDNISVNKSIISNLLEALSGRNEIKYLLTSSSAVYHLIRNQKENNFKESDVDVYHQYERNSLFQDREWDYIQGKADCERLLLDSNFSQKVIIRPNVILGKRDPIKRTNYFLERVHDKEGVLLPDEGHNTYHLVYSTNMARFYFDLIKNSNNRENLIVNYAQDEIFTNKKLISMIDKCNNFETPIFNVGKEKFVENEITPPPFGKWGKYELDLTLLKEVESQQTITPVVDWIKDLNDEYLQLREESYAFSFREKERALIKTLGKVK